MLAERFICIGDLIAVNRRLLVQPQFVLPSRDLVPNPETVNLTNPCIKQLSRYENVL